MVGNSSSDDFLCEQNLILVNATFNNQTDTLHEIQLLVSFKMSLCMLLSMYVLYSLCRIAFNNKQRDVFTTSIQSLFCASLFCRSLQISANLISNDTPEGIHTNYVLNVIYFYLADYFL